MIATRLAVTPSEVRLAICFRKDVARLAEFEDLRVGMNAHAEFLNGLKNFPEEAMNLAYCTEEKGVGHPLL
jgi:1,4-dihydroxy-2-naphthoyl-CoA synthase